MSGEYNHEEENIEDSGQSPTNRMDVTNVDLQDFIDRRLSPFSISVAEY